MFIEWEIGQIKVAEDCGREAPTELNMSIGRQFHRRAQTK